MEANIVLGIFAFFVVTLVVGKNLAEKEESFKHSEHKKNQT